SRKSNNNKKPPATISDKDITPVTGRMAQAKPTCESASETLALQSTNELTNTPASRIRRGHSAYVEPQSCCDRNEPWIVPMIMKGRTALMPQLRRSLQSAKMVETIRTKGHTPNKRSALSEESSSSNR